MKEVKYLSLCLRMIYDKLNQIYFTLLVAHKDTLMNKVHKKKYLEQMKALDIEQLDIFKKIKEYET